MINDEPTGAVKLTSNTNDGVYEKHVPEVEQTSDSAIVRVGSVAYPMLDAHYTTFIVLKTASGKYQRKDITADDEPIVTPAVTEPVVAAYEYCKLHGL